LVVLVVGCSSPSAPATVVPTGEPTPTGVEQPPPTTSSSEVDAGVAAQPVGPPRLDPTGFVQVDVSVSSDANASERGIALLGRRWCEGKTGDGIGESVTITLAQPLELGYVSVAAGVPRPARVDLDPEFNVPTSLLLVIDDGAPIAATPEAHDGTTGWTLAPPVTASTLTIQIGAVDTKKHRTSCLTGLSLGTADLDLRAVTFDAAALRQLDTAITAPIAAMSSCDENALKAVAEFPFRWAQMDQGYEPDTIDILSDAAALSRRCLRVSDEIRSDMTVQDNLDLALLEVLGDTLVFTLGSSFSHIYMRWVGTEWKLSGYWLDNV
jgi:hypothetical protein